MAVLHESGKLLPSPYRRLELCEQRIVAGEDVFDIRHDDALGAVLAQEHCEPVDGVGRTMQRQHPRRGRPAERGRDAEFRLGEIEQRVVAAGEAGTDLLVAARARLGAVGMTGRATGTLSSMRRASA